MTMNRKLLKQAIESIIITAVIIILNVLLKPDDPGFSKFLYIPYIIAAVFSSVFYGRLHGFINIAISIVSIALLTKIYSNSNSTFLHYSNAIIISVTIFSAYLFGTIREADHKKIKKTRERLKKYVKDLYWSKKISEAHLEINRELEERIAGQRVSITTLYNQMHKMDSLNLEKSLEILLETVQIFTDAEDVTIWTEGQTPGVLQSSASIHKSGTFDSSKILNIDDSIEGWVYRNNRKVSARMINNYENLKKMDTGKNLMTLPIPLNKKVWGVLNIEEMPFVKYNRHTEHMLEIIISLAEPAISHAVEYARQVQQSETDEDTKLPLFSQLYTMLNRHIAASTEQNARISLLIIEIQNYQDLISTFPEPEVKRLLLRLVDEILLFSAGLAEFFMFKNNSQMAVLIPGLDADGASLLCLEILELINSTNWSIRNEETFVEMIIGYSSLGDIAQDSDGLISHAEHLLEIQKI